VTSREGVSDTAQIAGYVGISDLPGLPSRLGHSTGGVIDASATGEAITFDAAGFVARVEPLLPSAYRLAAAMLHSSSDADDAVQEALFKAWRHFGRFRQGSDMRPWLLSIVANECRGQRRNRWSSVLPFTDQADVESSATAEFDAETADLRTALYRMPHDQRLVLVLRYYLDLNFDEIGAILKTSTKAAKSRTYRALARLRLSPEVLADE